MIVSIHNYMKITFSLLKYLLSFSPLLVILVLSHQLSLREQNRRVTNWCPNIYTSKELYRANFSYLMPLIYYSLRSHLMPQSLLFMDLWGNPIYSKWLQVYEVNCSIKALNSVKLLYAQSHYHVFAGQWSLWACRTHWSWLWFIQSPC